MKKIILASLIVLSFSTECFATANYVYHEQSSNYVATPQCTDGSTNTACGRYVENTDRSTMAGIQIYSTEPYNLHFKVEYQFYTNEVRVYYTTDGSNPSAAFGTPTGTTQVVTATYTCTFVDQSQGCQVVDICSAAIPAQAAGKTIKYMISAWHSGGGEEVFANSGTCGGCTPCTMSSTGCPTIYQYSSISQTLPLQFLSFNGKVSGSTASLNWTVAGESSMQNYFLQRGENGLDFRTITSIPAKNPGSATIQYSYNDQFIPNGSNYYRLIAVERSGEKFYSSVIRLGRATVADMAVFYDPGKAKLQVQTAELEKGIYTFTIFDNLGHTLGYEAVEHRGGAFKRDIMIRRLEPGSYFLRISDGVKTVSRIFLAR